MIGAAFRFSSNNMIFTSDVMTNSGLILTPEDLAFLRDVFGACAKIYPYGGHCGNMSYRENVAYMINFFKT